MSTQTKKGTKSSDATSVETRKITIYSTQAKSSQTIETSASTWGELKGELSDVGNVRAVVRETRNSLDTPSSKLPDQDFTLFMYPERVKSGNDEVQVAVKKKTVKVHKVKEAEWDSTADKEVEDTLEEYKTEFNALIDSVIPKGITLPSKEELELEKEAMEIAAEMGM